MKILMVITEGDLGGAQRHVLDASRELIRRGHVVTIAVGGTATEMEKAAATESPVVSVRRVPYLARPIRLMQDVRVIIALFKLVKELKPDIVHCHSSKAGAVGSVAGKLAGARVVYTAHGFVFREELSPKIKFLYRWVEIIASWFRDKVITVSRSDAEEAIRRHIVPARKIVTIQNGIDEMLAATFYSRANARATLSEWCGNDVSANKLVVAIANMYPAKNVPLLIRAFEFVYRRLPDARLIVIGDGKERPQCEKIIADTPALQKTVFLVGKRTDAYRILRGADVLCLSSTKEGLPYVILEAKLAGTPVVATRVGGVPEMGEAPQLTLVVPHSAEMLSEAIVETCRNPRPPAEGRLEHQFTLVGMVDAIEDVYEQVMKS